MGYLTNQTPVSAAEANFLVKNNLCNGTNGTNWTVPTSSNGVVYAAQGDVIDAAADLANASAWFVIQGRDFEDNGVVYHTQLCVQTNGTTGLRVKVSLRNGFTGGSPSVAQTPSAVDEFYLLGGGTDASPTYTTFWPSSGHRLQGYSDETDERQWFLSYPVGGGPAAALWFIDRPSPNPIGSGGNLLDKERIVFYAATGANCALCDGLSKDTTAPRSVFLYGDAAQLLGRCAPGMAYVFDSSGTPARYLPGGAATSGIYSEPTVPELPLSYARRAALAGTLLSGEVGDSNTCDEKGTSTMLRYGGQRKSSPVLLDSVNPSTGAVETGGALALGDLLFPWDGTALSV